MNEWDRFTGAPLRTCAILVQRPESPRPTPCTEPATGYWYSEGAQTLTPACRQHRNRTTWLEEVTP